MWKRNAIRAIGHGDQLSLVGHLDELRSRIIVSLLALTVAFGVCFWQNQHLLDLIDSPLAHQTQKQVRAGNGPLGATYRVQQSARDVAAQLRTVVGVLQTDHPDPATQASLQRAQSSLRSDVSRLSAAPKGNRPVTLGIGEPFTTTITVTLIFALILALPILLTQIYAFLVPALEPEQQRHVRPLMFAVPL